MWTPKGRTKSVHNIELSTLVKLNICTGFGQCTTGYIGKPNGPEEKCPQKWGVHRARFNCIWTGFGQYTTGYIGKTKRAGRKVSTVVGCPQGEVQLYLLYIGGLETVCKCMALSLTEKQNNFTLFLDLWGFSLEHLLLLTC